MLHLRWQPSPPPARLVALPVAAFPLAACSGPSGVDPRGNPISFAPSTADCAQATALIAEGFPQRAVALIDQMNQDLTDDQPRRCIDERAAALARIAASERLAQAAAALDPPPPYADLPVTDTAVAKCPLEVTKPPDAGTAPDVTSGTVLRDALLCDRENAAAMALNGTLGSTAAQSHQEAWAKYVERYITPWRDVGVAFLLWLTAVFVAMQLLPRLWGSTLARPWRWLAIVGGGFVVAGAFLGTAGVLVLPAEWPTPQWLTERLRPIVGAWTLVPALLLTIVGTLLWDAQRRGQKKLLVTVDGEHTQKAADNLRGIISDMGAAGPRGLKTPAGTDVTFLSSVDMTVLGEGIAKAAQSLLLAVKPSVPWELAVTGVSDDRLAVTLKRNHRQIASEIIDRYTLKVDDASLKCVEHACTAECADSDSSCGADARTVDLSPFAAALAICWMAKTHKIKQGLGGATNWRAVAYQHLATTQLKSRKAVAKALLGRAVDLDPGNHSAALAYWSLHYNSHTDTASLNEYESLLVGLAEDIRTEALAAAPALPSSRVLSDKLRKNAPREEWQFELTTNPGAELPDEGNLLLALPGDVAKTLQPGSPDRPKAIARLRSRRWTRVRRTVDPALLLRTEYALTATRINLKKKPDAQRALHRLTVLMNVVSESKDESRAKELVLSMRPLVEAARAMVNGEATPPGIPSGPVGGPKRHYMDACTLGESDQADKVTAAGGLLPRADLDADLASWRTRDPQLDQLRRQDDYREAFFKDPPDDILTIAPFTPYALGLRAAGLTSPERILACTDNSLVGGLGISRFTFALMQQYAALIVDLQRHEELARVSLLLAEMLEKRNIRSLVPHPACLTAAAKAVAGYKGEPSDGVLAKYFVAEQKADSVSPATSGSSHPNMSRSEGTGIMPEAIPARGRVGEGADTSILHIRNERGHAMRAVIRVTARDLCPSFGALGTLLVGSEPRISLANLNDTRMLLETTADAGQDVVLVVHLIRTGDEPCIRLGETQFELDLAD